MPSFPSAVSLAAAALLRIAAPSFAQSSAIVGRVVQLDSLAVGACADGCPLADATVRVVRSDGALAREAVTIGDGSFRVDSLTPGLYTVTARRVGYRNAELDFTVRNIETGDQVLFNPEDRYEVEVRGEDYLILRERDIHAVASERIEGGTGLYL